jgi:hypothetical protein
VDPAELEPAGLLRYPQLIRMSPESSRQLSEHRVQLFDSSKSLAETVSAFLVDGLQRGGSVLLAVTPEHRELLGGRIEAAGWNVRNAVAANRLVMVDAVKTLDKFMRRDRPSPVAFDEVVGTLVRRLSGDEGQRVWIYGEMVDVLASRGNLRGAIELEALWNALSRRETFTLLCGYASGHFGDVRSAAALGDICAAHDKVERRRDDILAEFLLNQPDVKRRLTVRG